MISASASVMFVYVQAIDLTISAVDHLNRSTLNVFQSL